MARVLSCLVSCLALPRLALPCLASPCLALPCLALPCLVLPCLALPSVYRPRSRPPSARLQPPTPKLSPVRQRASALGALSWTSAMGRLCQGDGSGTEARAGSGTRRGLRRVGRAVRVALRDALVCPGPRAVVPAHAARVGMHSRPRWTGTSPWAARCWSSSATLSARCGPYAERRGQPHKTTHAKPRPHGGKEHRERRRPEPDRTGSAGRSACCTGAPATSGAIESLRCPSGHPLSRPTAARPAGVCARSVRRALRRAPPQRCVHPPRLAGDARHASSGPTPRALAGRCLGDRRRRGHRRRPSASAPSLGERAGQAAAQRIGDGWRCRAPRAGAGSIRKPCCGQVCPTGGAA